MKVTSTEIEQSLKLLAATPRRIASANRNPFCPNTSAVQFEEGIVSSLTNVINLGGVNCYLLAAGDGYILIDTGFAAKRVQLENSLESVGCKPGKLKLIVLTHGDSDHADNCAYLRSKYGCKIAMHRLDSGMVERGDMSWNRKAKRSRVKRSNWKLKSTARLN